MLKMGAPKNAILSLLTFGFSSVRLRSLLRLYCSCAVFAGRGFHCFASASCCVCAALVVISRARAFNNLICASVGGCFPGRLEIHRVHLPGFAVLAWTRAHVAARSFERDEDMKAIFAIRPQQSRKVRYLIIQQPRIRITHLLVTRSRSVGLPSKFEWSQAKVQ